MTRRLLRALNNAAVLLELGLRGVVWWTEDPDGGDAWMVIGIGGRS